MIFDLAVWLAISSFWFFMGSSIDKSSESLQVLKRALSDAAASQPAAVQVIISWIWMAGFYGPFGFMYAVYRTVRLFLQ